MRLVGRGPAIVVSCDQLWRTAHWCASYRTASYLVRFPIVCTVVGGVSVTHHGHDIGKRSTRAIVLIGVEEDAEALEVVC